MLEIAADVDGEGLFVQPSTGVVFVGDADKQTSLETTLASFLGDFRDNIVCNKYEWCDGWVEKA